MTRSERREAIMESAAFKDRHLLEFSRMGLMETIAWYGEKPDLVSEMASIDARIAEKNKEIATMFAQPVVD